MIDIPTQDFTSAPTAPHKTGSTLSAQLHLWSAMRLVDSSGAKLALAHGADPNAVETSRPNGERVLFMAPPLIQAAISPHPKSVELAKALLDFNARLELDDADEAPRSILIESVKESSAFPSEKVALFLQRGARPNAIDSLRGQTTAHWICQALRHKYHARSIIESLVQAGADLSIQNYRGMSVFDCAIEHGNLLAIDALWRVGARPQWESWEAKSQEPGWPGAFHKQKGVGLQAARALLERELLDTDSMPKLTAPNAYRSKLAL